uniref:Microtubule-associated protein 6 homolog n=1 Tax=Xiphophorus maculatus TaxID=8083 RepID=M4AKS7_XIPMA
MAWPCISRVCCLARFWNQFDKSDLSVPLTIQNYSDIAEQEPRVRGSLHAPPREDYHPPGVPFPSVTQYKQDFKPWPIPRKDNFPWISNGGSRGDGASDSSPVNSYHLQAQVGERRGDRLEQQVTEENKTSSYRYLLRFISPSPPSLTQEHLVRTKLPPNPSAVFQSGSRVFNI